MKRFFLLPLFLMVAGVAMAAHPDGNINGTSTSTTGASVAVAPGFGGSLHATPGAAVVDETPTPSSATATPTPAPRRERGLRNRVRTAMQNSIAGMEMARAAQGTQSTNFFQRVAGKLMAKISKLLQGDSVAVAIILWFFLGGLAVHRVYLGTKGIMILWYFLTCGGLFGLCPLFDIIQMIIDFDRLKNNNKFFSIAG